MRTRVVLLAVVLSAWRVSAVSEQTGDPLLLDPIRTALGGGSALDAVHSFTAEGRCLRVIGPLTMASRITLTLVRPDRYLRADALLVVKGAQTVAGFDGDRVIQRATTADGHRIDPVDLLPSSLKPPAAQGAAGEIRRDARLLLLGWFAGSFDSTPVVVESRGVAEAPEGKADAFQLTFADASTVTLFADIATHLPLMVSWSGPDTLAPLRPSAQTLPPGSAPPGNPPPPVEHRLYFSDYRRVGSVRWPFAVRRAVKGELIEELRFDRIVPNATVDVRLFDDGR
jgi:hypothetical protein